MEKEEEEKFLGDLKDAVVSGGKRNKLDQYREFRDLFLGTDLGKRVLHDILGMAKLSARMVKPYPAEVDTKRMLLLEGARQLACDILDALHKEPNMEKPTHQARTRFKSNFNY